MRTKSLVLAGLFAAITAISAQISIPLSFTPVPITMQVLAVCLAGGILGARLGAVSQLVYILLGAFGMPVFAQGKAGLNVLFGPTGGYIIGFVIAAYVIGLVIEKRMTYLSTLVAMFLGLVIIYFLGTIQLKFVLDLTWQKALIFGVGWFLPLDILKIFIGAALSVSVRRALVQSGMIANQQGMSEETA
ncbi:biotin transporter BioY [Calderihabitans maritimus]|uniref:Biotin transporter n=1 Tax=Calderihabitans maritimus TaxID=1246530 RepID=A0A1Z5HU62_9FIRM|nr:biotin transporter BioY [Calderihabitans maritimus]GAW92887.1 BioY family protein [Calderihabitans maritimus]